MKRLTLSTVARSNLRINRKAYVSLFLGILAAVFLATATSLCAWGTVRGHEEQMARRVGWMDMFILGNDGPTDEQLRDSGFFREIGHVTVTATTDRGDAAGYYDETAAKLMNRIMEEGRMPEKAGEIAAERSALTRLGLGDIAVGDTLTLNMNPIRGSAEKRSFTLTGILNEQTSWLTQYREEEGMRFPAFLVFPEEKPYTVGSAEVHRVLTYAPLITFNQVMRKVPYLAEGAAGVSRETGETVYYDSGWERAEKTLGRILMWAVLGAAMMLSACVGISSAMESLLSRKTQDIGMLRAIGATRKQIRRIYGAEAWLLTATALPAGLAAGLAAAWIISRISPEQVVFEPKLWLLVPILAASALCVFAASRVPLHRASRQMPMGVLRDTDMLRRASAVRTRPQFSPARLIAGRRTRLYPLRRLGAAGMTALTLISTLMLGELALGMNRSAGADRPDFELYSDVPATDYEAFAQTIRPDAVGRAEVRRLGAIGGVEKVTAGTTLRANLLADEVPGYFRPRTYRQKYATGETGTFSVGALDLDIGPADWLFYTDEDLADARARQDEDWEAQMCVRSHDRAEMIRSRLGITGNIVPIRILVTDPDAEALKEFVTDGAIDPEKLDRGEQVLVYAPTIGIRETENGGHSVDLFLTPRNAGSTEWDEVIRNDAFTRGMPLKLLELPGEEPEYGDEEQWKAFYGQSEPVFADVSVGAVMTGPVKVNGFYLSRFTVIVSEKGAEALGLKLPDTESVNVYLASGLSREAESAVTEQLEQFTIVNGFHMVDNLTEQREYRARKLRQILLFAGLILLFFAVSVSMQVSGAARQIRSETRTIGTLRAVGADIGTLVKCYSLPVWTSAALGLIPALLIYAVKAVPGLRLFTTYHPLVIIPVLLVLAAFVALACTAGIRRRLALVSRQSIVENIREL